MAIVLAVLLGLCALAFVLYPLYRQVAVTGSAQALVQDRHSTAEEIATGDGVVQPTDSEHAARSALQEVELDFQLGNISQGDYNQLRGRYTQRALLALKQRYEREQEFDAAIEEQLQQMRMQEEQGQEEHGETT